MSDPNTTPYRTTQDTRQLEEKSLLGSSYSNLNVGQTSTQTTQELANSEDD